MHCLEQKYPDCFLSPLFLLRKYGRKVQLGLIKPTIVDKIVPDTYKVKSAQMETFDVEAG